jgi:microcystin degradation protein MlrC
MPGELYRRVREVIGPKIPLVVTTDTHANFSKQMVDNVDVFVGYDTYPHIDQYERAEEAAKLLSQIIQGEIKPTMAMARPNMMPAVIACQSDLYPMKHLYDMAHEIEDDGSAITVTVTGGYAYADKPEMGMAVLVTTDNDVEQAQNHADKMAGWAWRHRREFLSKLMSPEDAVREAIEEPEGPIVMGDPGDSLGGGGPGDGTVLLSELIRQKAKDALIGCIRDPEAVSKAVDAGLGKKITMRLGGKITNLVGEPLKITGYVKTISDGKFISTGPMGNNLEINMGQTVVLDVDSIDVVITELPYSPNQWPWTTLGIEAEKKKIVCLKSAAHYKAVWKPFAKKFIDPDTPGPHGSNLGGFRYVNLKRPIFPIDTELLGVAELNKTVYKDIVLHSCYEK